VKRKHKTGERKKREITSKTAQKKGRMLRLSRTPIGKKKKGDKALLVNSREGEREGGTITSNRVGLP